MKVSVSSVKMLRMAVELSEYFADSEEKKKNPTKNPNKCNSFFFSPAKEVVLLEVSGYVIVLAFF